MRKLHYVRYAIWLVLIGWAFFLFHLGLRQILLGVLVLATLQCVLVKVERWKSRRRFHE